MALNPFMDFYTTLKDGKGLRTKGETGLTDNCLQTDYAVGYAVQPNEVLNVTNVKDFAGGKISIGVRWKNGPVNFKVSVAAYSLSGDVMNQDTIIDKYSTRQSAVYELKHKRSAVFVENTGTTEQVLSAVTITEFISDAVAPTNGSREYYGYSYSDKPANASIGDKFLELDTGNVYVYYGRNWVVF